jgi:membrane protein implicated in regulation of membrane protease activity
MRKKTLLVLEIIWIIVGVVCIAAGIKFAFMTGGNRVFIFILMAIISFAFAWVRHRQRKKS